VLDEVERIGEDAPDRVRGPKLERLCWRSDLRVRTCS
jgi:hypothetical protein